MARVVMLLSNAYRPDARVRKEALALQEEGHDILLLAWDREGARPREEDVDGIHVGRIWTRAGYDDLPEFAATLPLVWCRMLRRLLRARFEVVHCHDLDTLPVGLLAARLRGVPCVFDAHELYSAMVGRSTPGPLLRLLRWVERWFARRPELVITVNEVLRETYAAMGARRVAVVMNSPTTEDLEVGDVAAVRERLGTSGKGLCVYVGMLERSRNLDTVLHAFGGMADDAVLLIGGRGTRAEAVAAAAEDLPNVDFVGWVSPEDVASIVAAADVVLLLDDPNYEINRVGTSTRLLQAMALGVPVVASRGTANAEVVEREEVGVCVNHDDVQAIREAVRALLRDQERRHAMAAKGPPLFRERYRWEAMKERLAAGYRSLALDRRH